MRFSCEKCAARFTIADEKVRGKVVAVRCSKCGEKITINGKSLVAPEAQAEERTHVAPAADLAALRSAAARDPDAGRGAPPASRLQDGWYAIVEGAQVGPLSAADTRARIAALQIGPRTYVWRDGMGDWLRAADVPELQPLVAPAPPPAPVEPPPPPTAAFRERAAAPEPAVRAAPEAAARAAPEPAVRAAPEVAARSAPEPASRAAFQSAKPVASASPFDAFSEPEERTAAGPVSPDLDALLFGKESGSGAVASPSPAPAASAPAAEVAAPVQHADPGPFPKAADPFTEAAAPAASDPFAKVDTRDPFALAAAQDPFAAVPDSPDMSAPGEIGEQTRFFMKQAGVTRRNPWWKIALGIGLGVGLPVGIVMLLSQLHIVKLEITKVDESTGQQVTVSAFSSEGMSGLRDMLMGKNKPKKPVEAVAKGPKVARATPAVAKTSPTEDAADNGIVQKRQTIDFPSTMTETDRAMAAAIYKNDEKTFAGPNVRADKTEKVQVDGQAGLDPKAINETVAKNLKAFQTCNDNELRRNPSFRGGKINITFTVGSSGLVTRAAIDKREIDQSALGTCLKEKAKRVMFPSFEGEPFDVEVPLVLTAGM